MQTLNHGERSPQVRTSDTSQALKNIRAFAIVMVVSFHSLLAYLGSQPAGWAPFDQPPYHWMGIPILDRARWFGFDVFSGFNYMSLMPLMFLLSGLFVLPSLARKGAHTFIRERLVRLGLPLVLGLFFLMPLAYYPVYRLSAASPSFVAFLREWLALPVWPSGPLWFLWELLVFDLMIAGVYMLTPRSGEVLARLAGKSAVSDRRGFAVLLAFSAAGYIPLALIFGPWDWIYFGPLAIQPDRMLLYAVYFLAGAGLGAYGLESGLLSADGPLARRWKLWVSAAVGSFLLWMICMAPLRYGASGILLDVIAYFTVALLVTSACFCFVALSLRFATKRSGFCSSLSENAYRIYVVHYVFVVWLQYLLLAASMPAIAKGTIVFLGTLALSWGVAAAFGLLIALLTAAMRERAPFATSRPRPSQKNSLQAWAVDYQRPRGSTGGESR